jgi:biotin synthase-related radical SAM superfamily protein
MPLVAIDLLEGRSEAQLDAISDAVHECPALFVVGTGAHSGATEDEMRMVRAAVSRAVESNERVSVFATTPHKHTQILSKAPDAVVAAIEDVIHKSS